MTIEKQVTNLELSKRLKELGVKQESLFWHTRISDTPDGRQDWLLRDTQWGQGALEEYSAFTVAELGEMLPEDIRVDASKHDHRYYRIHTAKCADGWTFNYEGEELLKQCVADTEADARGLMLEYLLKNKLI